MIGQGNFTFQNAEEQDIKRIAEIEKECLGTYRRAFTEEQLVKWFSHNPAMFYVIKDEENKVYAFTILVPITENLYNDVKTDKISELSDFPEKEVSEAFKSDYFHIADICVSKTACGPYYLSTFRALAGGMVKILYNEAKLVNTSAVTDDGAKACKSIGFTEVSKNTDGHIIWELIVTPEKYNRLAPIFGLSSSKTMQ